MTALVSLENVTVTANRAVLLNSISFSVERGSLAVLLGPNGSGKTTVLRALAGATKHTGTILINGRDITRSSTGELAHIRAYAQQEPAFPPDMTVWQFVLLARSPHFRRLSATSEHDHKAVRAGLEQCDIAAFANRKLGSLSGGEKRRAALAQALAQDTPLVLLDEPTAALDIGHQQRFMDLVDRIRLEKEVTFIVALHDLTLTSQYATDVVFLQNGQLVASGPTEEILQREALEERYQLRLSQFSDGNRDIFAPRRSFT